MLLTGPDEAAHKIIYKGCQDFVLRWPMGGLLILGQYIKVQQGLQVQTLATDGANIWINPNYIKAVNEKEGLRGVVFRVCHEYLHIYFNHVDRAKHRDFKVWNVAIDIITNRLTEEILSTDRDTWKTPADGISPKGWELFETAEKVYEELMKRKKAEQPMPQPQGVPTAAPTGSPSGVTYEDPYDNDMEGEFSGSDLLPSPFESEEEKHDWQDGITEEICQAQAVMEMNPTARPLPGAITERLSKIKEGRIPWSRLLTGKLLCDVGDDIATFSPPRKRLYPLLILPSYKGVQEKVLFLAIDNSASVGEELHDEFKAAIMPAARRADRIHIVGFDAVVREHFTTRRPQEIQRKFKYKQGGHSYTSVIEVFELVDKIKPTALAILTDGFIELPPVIKPLYRKTIWCIPLGGRKQAWGTNFIMDIAW